MSYSGGPQNGLLAALRPESWAAVRSSLHEVPLNHDELLIDVGEPYRLIYFPTLGVVSTVALFESGAVVEMADIGAEGMVGMGAVLGSRTALSRHIVQVPGVALVAEYELFKRWQQEVPGFQHALLSYAQAFVSQILQLVACNAIHSANARAARWLLTCDDRSGSGAFALTQQFLGEMLGVSRPVVSRIAGTFAREGLIRYRHGVIAVQNRDGLEKASCECYGLIRRAYEQRLINLDAAPTARVQ